MFQHDSAAQPATKLNPFAHIGSNRLTEAYAFDNARAILNLTATKQFSVAPTAPGWRMQGENALIIAEGLERAEGLAHIDGEADPQTHNIIAVGIKTKGSDEQRYAYRISGYCQVRSSDNNTGPTRILPFFGYREEDLASLDTNRRVAKYLSLIHI